ncbi:MAG: DegT/DnrJ/EryC1/StrS family aminotransferase [Opitutae bacterium]|nr:DegT/DnrJ/EryC1/StrS family aminotransferase [Opitutae bacterium]
MSDSSRVLLTADPGEGFRAHADQIRAAIERVLTSNHYILGPEVEAFEREFAAYLGGGQVLGVANGTEAIELALRAVGVQRGDQVATVANTVSATIAAIEQIGASPVFVEIDVATMVMSVAALAESLQKANGRIKAVLPVHLYGHPADMPAICELATRHGVAVVEDCAQAHGATVAGRKAGAWGAAAAFSFYPTKNLGAIGDGGAVFARDPAVAERVRLLRQYGWRQRYVSEIPGRNSRLDEIQAAILRVKLPHLDAENARRAQLASVYLERLAKMPAGFGDPALQLRLPKVATGIGHAWHQFTVRTPRRDALATYLGERGIRCGVLYPTPAHRQPAYAQPALTLPLTERACAEVLCLPCHPGLTTADIDRVCAEILGWSAA